MTENQRNKFTKLLKAYGIQDESSYILFGCGMYHVAPPKRDVCVDIPDEEDFENFSEPYKRYHPDIESLKYDFLNLQMEQVLSQNQNPKKATTNVSPSDSLLQIGREFKDVQEVNLFKQQLSKYYNSLATQNGWSTPISTCLIPDCFNPAVPTFLFCAEHIVMDKNFSKLTFLSECSESTSVGKCKNPASSKTHKCRYHTKL